MQRDSTWSLFPTVTPAQDEVDTARLAGVTIVVLVPGMGDDVQAIKAGIIEIADVFVINKSDLPGAEKLERELNNYLGLSHRPDGWTPKIVHAVATDGKGITEALEAAREYQKQSSGKSRAEQRYRRQQRRTPPERVGVTVGGRPFRYSTTGFDRLVNRPLAVAVWRLTRR